MDLLSHGHDDMIETKEKKKEFKSLFKVLIEQNEKVVTDIIEENPKVLNMLKKLTPQEASQFMTSMNMSMSSRRKMARILGQILQYNPFGSEHKQREYQKSKTELMECSKVDHGKMSLFKTPDAEFPTMVPYDIKIWSALLKKYI